MAAPALHLSPLTAHLQRELLLHEGVAKLSPCRRFTTLFSANSPIDNVYYLASGMVKISKQGSDGKEIIVTLIGPGELFGEQALLLQQTREVSAQMVETGTVYVIPIPLFMESCDRNPGLWRGVSELALRRQRELERKIELLCLRDVEQRILLTLADLARSIGSPVPGGTEYSIPLSQSELASLIGATRETTSTTLNNLERQGLLHLGRRLLVISSIQSVIAAAERPAPRAAAATA